MFSGKSSYPGNLVLKVLARELEGEKCRRDEVWFEIGRSPYRFGKQEFLLVTGLHFGKISQKVLELDNLSLSKESIFRRLFKNKPKVSSEEVIDLLNEQVKTLTSDDALKLLYAVFVQRFLIGTEPPRAIKPFLWHLVDDLPKFEKFPWGTYAYSHTLDGIRKVITANRLQKTKCGINIYGFPWSFAV